MGLILDTNALSALFGGASAIADVLTMGTPHHLPVIAIGEYRFGLMRSRTAGRFQRLLDLLIRESIVLPIDEETADHYARVREELRKAARAIPENDLWIAALARQYDQPIVSRDTHFDAVHGVKRLGW